MKLRKNSKVRAKRGQNSWVVLYLWVDFFPHLELNLFQRAAPFILLCCCLSWRQEVLPGGNRVSRGDPLPRVVQLRSDRAQVQTCLPAPHPGLALCGSKPAPRPERCARVCVFVFAVLTSLAKPVASFDFSCPACL